MRLAKGGGGRWLGRWLEGGGGGGGGGGVENVKRVMMPYKGEYGVIL